MDFADQLREAMGDLTQEELEDLTRGRINQTTISRYLRRLAEPNLTRLAILEEALPRLRKIRLRELQVAR